MRIKMEYLGNIDLKDDVRANIYYNPHMKGKIKCFWGTRNTVNSYKGVIYMDKKTGNISYPNDVVITEQTDGEVLPNVVVVGDVNYLDEHFISFIKEQLVETYKKKNNL